MHIYEVKSSADFKIPLNITEESDTLFLHLVYVTTLNKNKF